MMPDAEGFNMLRFILANPGLIIGLVLVIAATAVLPKRIRWYVLTAGLAVITYRAWQVIRADKRLKEADKKREELQNRLGELNTRRTGLEEEVGALNNQLDAVRTQKNELAAKAAELEAAGGDIDTRKAELDNKLKELKQKDAQLMREIDSRENAISLFDQADQAYKELDKVEP